MDKYPEKSVSASLKSVVESLLWYVEEVFFEKSSEVFMADLVVLFVGELLEFFTCWHLDHFSSSLFKFSLLIVFLGDSHPQQIKVRF